MMYMMEVPDKDFTKKVKSKFSVLNENDKWVTCQSKTGTKYTIPRKIFDEFLKTGQVKKVG